MNIITEQETDVNNKSESGPNQELRFGKIIRSPIIAWGFDTATASLSPVPFATGPYGRFVKNKHDSTWQFVQALPGACEVSYLVDPKHWRSFSEYPRESAGAVFLGVELAGDDANNAEDSGVSWLALARDYEAEYYVES